MFNIRIAFFFIEVGITCAVTHIENRKLSDSPI